MKKRYRYSLRPAYGSKDLLLEFIIDDPGSAFDRDLFSALDDLQPDITALQDLWMNDEIILTISCTKGELLYSKDIWGFAFIMAQYNQECVIAIDEILQKSELFLKEEVDYEDYRKSSA